MKEDVRDFSIVKDAIDGYLELNRNEVLDLNDKLLNIAREHEPMEVLIQIQNFMTELLKSNINNRILKIKLISDINAVEKAKKELLLNMNIQTVIENLCFELVLNK